MASRPAVSVVLPCRNQAPFLGGCLASLAGQTFRDFEVLFVDDASTDGTAAVFRRWRRPGWHYLRNARRLGPARSRARALRKARGRLTAFLDSDDLWRPGKLAAQVRALRSPAAVMSHTAYFLLDARGRARPATGRDSFGPPWREFASWWERFCPVPFPCTSSFAARTAALREVGGMDESFRRLHDDTDLVLRLYRRFGRRAAVYLREPLVGYRRHAGQISWPNYRKLIRSRGRAEGLEAAQRDILVDRAHFFIKWSKLGAATPSGKPPSA